MVKKSITKIEKTILQIPYILKRENSGYVVECVDLDVITQGDTVEEARKNIKEAILLHLKSALELGILDEELEKLGVVKKKNKLEVLPRDLESAQIEIPR